MSVCPDPTQSSHEPAATKPVSGHPQRPSAPDPFLDGTPPSGDNSKAMYTLAAAVGVGTLLIACGLVFSRSGSTDENTSAAPMTTTLGEQHKMMREAVQLAKDANEMQRERVELMRREMERNDRDADAPARAEGEFVGD